MKRLGAYELIAMIRDDEHSGAAELGRKALDVLIQTIYQSSHLKSKALQIQLNKIGKKLMTARPSMLPVSNMVEDFLGRLQEIDLSAPDYFKQCISIAEELKKKSVEAQENCARKAGLLLENYKTLATLSYSSTVLKTLAFLKSKSRRVLIGESRPLCEGLTLGKEVKRIGHEVVIYTDAALLGALREAQVAIIGADIILKDGSVVNKVGSLGLALSARHFGIPFYVIAETMKRQRRKEAPRIEEKSPKELGKIPKGMAVKNPYFEIVPKDLITTIITEK